MAAKKVGVLVKEARTAAGLTQEKLAKAAGEKLTAADISKCERGEADLTAAQLKKIAVACGVTQASLVNAPKNISAAAAKKATPAKTTTAKTTTAKTAAAKATSSKTAAAKATTAKTAAAKTTAAKATAAKATTAKTTAAKTTAAKTTAAKTTAAKAAASKPAAKTASTAKKTGTSTAKKTPAAAPANANVSMKVTTTEQKLIQAYRGATSDRKKAALKLLNGEYGETVDKILSVTNGNVPSSASGSDLLGDMLGGVLGNLFGGK